MKPLYIFLLFYATFITALADGLSIALSVVPYVGIVVALVLSYCINVTMGSGLILLLAINGMYHPKWGPAGFIGGLIPGINVLPFWIGVVIAGIAHDASKEGGIAGAVGGAVQGASAAVNGNVTGVLKGAKSAVATMRPTVSATPANDNKETPQERTPNMLQTKNFDGIKPAGSSHIPYVPKAA